MVQLVVATLKVKSTTPHAGYLLARVVQVSRASGNVGPSYLLPAFFCHLCQQLWGAGRQEWHCVLGHMCGLGWCSCVEVGTQGKRHSRVGSDTPARGDPMSGRVE